MDKTFVGQKDQGLGLFTAEPVEEGQPVIEFLGEMLLEKSYQWKKWLDAYVRLTDTPLTMFLGEKTGCSPDLYLFLTEHVDKIAEQVCACCKSCYDEEEGVPLQREFDKNSYKLILRNCWDFTFALAMELGFGESAYIPWTVNFKLKVLTNCFCCRKCRK
uniref:Uncharacterized protein n=1 Tax=Chromera velia CCMP2878 TaxID=1169474 RepID=A0A0G4HKQ4_9ALVE|eukprot:Cvel_28519.t1-p1 / transcript=Cvel_28519.t1 / gene=Cvel_28519 / organism=Chromera_velia_CCMP2878 / gene_product=hypothetical protein / transcript_product=hypothetical protein / location=Cvel_scaffold3752:613-4703(-) / protein_length=159 / sequence_SO=supercontig / SO=protein_coding / is_pseudo=false